MGGAGRSHELRHREVVPKVPEVDLQISVTFKAPIRFLDYCLDFAEVNRRPPGVLARLVRHHLQSAAETIEGCWVHGLRGTMGGAQI